MNNLRDIWDRIVDFVLNIGDYAQDAWWWMSDNKKRVGSLLGLAVLALVLFMGIKMVNDPNTGVSDLTTADPTTLKTDSVEQLAAIKKQSKPLRNVFSQLSFQNQNPDSDYTTLFIDLFVKQPFIDNATLERDLDSYANLVRAKFANNGKNKGVRGIKITLYDRKAVYDAKLAAKGTYTYQLNSEYNPDTKKSKDDNYLAENTYKSGEEIAWDLTVNSDGKPDYTKYTTYFTYKDLKSNASIALVSDQEFAWFLKFSKYMGLTGSVGAAATLYMQWEWGANADQSNSLLVSNMFQAFVNRLGNIKDTTIYYQDNDIYALKSQLVISNPQFLYYALTKKVERNAMTARKYLIQLDPDQYTQVVNNWIDQQATDIANGNTKISSADKSSMKSATSGSTKKKTAAEKAADKAAVANNGSTGDADASVAQTQGSGSQLPSTSSSKAAAKSSSYSAKQTSKPTTAYP